MFDWVLGVIEAGGYLGIFGLMVLENIFPPIPSELILPLSGYAAAMGEMNLLVVILVATLGAVVGALPWYFLGRVFGLSRLTLLSSRFGRLLTLSPDDIKRADEWFKDHGKKAVLLGRLMPTVRTLISVPAGLARMPLPTFIFYTMLGSLVWTTLLTSAGYLLESQHEKVSVYLDPISNLIVILIVSAYLYRVVTFKK